MNLTFTLFLKVHLENALMSESASDDEPIRPPKRQTLRHAFSSPATEHDPQATHVYTSSVDDSLKGDKENHVSEEPKAQKPKYRIHVPTNPEMPEDTFLTQPPSRSPSPYRIDKFCWRKPARPKSPRSDLQFRRVAPTSKPLGPGYAQRQHPTVHSVPPSAKRTMPVHEGTAASSNQAPRECRRATSEEVYNDVLDDLPSDAFSSPEPPARAVLNQPIEISSQDVDSQLGSSQLQRRPRPAAPLANLRQRTLFGEEAPGCNTQTQSVIKRNWPLANKEEPPTHHKIDRQAMETWIYPINLGKIREYQYSIVARGLYHNMLVALPTGLGKTFIAATIMLNWFRWTIDAQIVFVAPTKPLVAQQIQACLEIAGIPVSMTVMLTGATAPGIRAEEWLTKRVFFMTPQTIINDLKTGICDPKRLVLLVVDEAHRATGGYAYVEAVQFLRRFNTSFRVLALTATPGSSIESVQEVIDGLGISRIEIRTEDSLDIREYVHPRKTESVLFDPSDEMDMIMGLFAEALQPLVDKLRGLNSYWSSDPKTLTAYGCTQARSRWMSSDAGRNASFAIKGMVNQIFPLLASLAHGIELLKFHGIGPFYRKVRAFQDAIDGSGSKVSKYRHQINDSKAFRTMMSRLRIWINNPDFVGHPKLEYLQAIVLKHFLDAGEGRGASAPSGTRIMVFAHYRDSAEEIARVLKRNDPMIRPRVFVGQANSKDSEGMDQKTQLDVIQKFQSGIYNTLVATSIGEEGLDIGEVDLIVCYDASASPIRMLQRMGRTGRKRAGKIVVTLMKGKEENNFVKAQDSYERMQHEIAVGVRFNFRDDQSHRIVPKEIQPVVDKKVVDIPIENTQADLPQPTKRARPPKRPPKKFHMPDGVRTGFVNASRVGADSTSTESDTASHCQARLRVESPEPLPPLSEVLLSHSEQRELERRYLDVQGDFPRFVELPRMDAFPKLQRDHRPTKHILHGGSTGRVVRALKVMHSLTADADTEFKKRLHSDDQRRGLLQVQRRAFFLKPLSGCRYEDHMPINPATDDVAVRQPGHLPEHSVPSEDKSSADDTDDPTQGTPGYSETDSLRSRSLLVTPGKIFYRSARTVSRNVSGSEEDLPDFGSLIKKRGTTSPATLTRNTNARASPRSKPRKRRKVVSDCDSDG